MKYTTSQVPLDREILSSYPQLSERLKLIEESVSQEHWSLLAAPPDTKQACQERYLDLLLQLPPLQVTDLFKRMAAAEGRKYPPSLVKIPEELLRAQPHSALLDDPSPATIHNKPSEKRTISGEVLYEKIRADISYKDWVAARNQLQISIKVYNNLSTIVSQSRGWPEKVNLIAHTRERLVRLLLDFSSQPVPVSSYGFDPACALEVSSKHLSVSELENLIFFLTPHI